MMPAEVRARMPKARRAARGLAALAAVALLTALPAGAQQAGSPFVGFSQNRDQPINFEADRAEVLDNERKAILTGNVRIRQGESSLAASRLVILYENPAGGGRPATTSERQPATVTASPTQNVRRFEMEGGVVVTSRNQSATAERGSFDARRNEAVMEGNVVLTQCGNVLRGSRLFADLTANRVRLDGGASTGGRVSGVLSPAGQGAGGSNNPECAGAPARRPAPRG
ncbi:LptA/OstA family protein [Phreatobacter sp.]|uniref:LptA/OstA family protein n=1 Tax=Phreatobacter sp. TaxID=1966341 RepID=UPI003F6E9BF5